MYITIGRPTGFSNIGNRVNQEDSLYPALGEATEDTKVFLVCDGMGGHEHGEVASQAVSSVIGGVMANIADIDCQGLKGLFASSLAMAYAELDKLDVDDSLKKMGTTLTFLARCTDGVIVAHIGDSRVYQFRPGKGIVFQTRDHSLVNELISIGEITEEEAATHPQRNVITRAMMPHQENPSRATVKTITDVEPGDVFLLCSDGVVEKHSNDDLISIILGEGTLEEKVEALSQSCTSRDTRDNNTVYAMEVTEVSSVVSNAEEEEEPVKYDDDIVLVPETESIEENENQINNNEDMSKSENNSGNDAAPMSDRNSKIIILLLVAIIVLGLGYMLFGGSTHEQMRDPDASRSNTTILDDDTTNYEEKLIQEGLPEEEKKKEEEKEEQTSTTTSTPSTTSTETVSQPQTEADLPVFDNAPAVEAPEAPSPQSATPAPTIKSKKIIEDVKEGPSENAVISE